MAFYYRFRNSYSMSLSVKSNKDVTLDLQAFKKSQIKFYNKPSPHLANSILTFIKSYIIILKIQYGGNKMFRENNMFKKSVILSTALLCTIGVFTACSSGNENSSSVSQSSNVVSNENVSTVSSEEKSLISSEAVSESSEASQFEYKVPSSLNDDYTSYTFRFQGDIYTMPMPVSEFTKNGWTIVAQNDSIKAGQEALLGLCVTKDDMEFLFNVKNFTDKTISAKDAMATSVYINSTLNKNVDFELSGGIKFGMSESELLKIVGAENLQKNDTPTGCEYMYNSRQTQGYKGYTFIFDKTGKFVEINMNKTVLD